MVKIRLQKLGRRNRAYFRIVATDVRGKRQGTYLEKLGQYDPLEVDRVKAVVVDGERVKHWIDQGAQLSDAVASLLRNRGLELVKKPAKKKVKKAKKVSVAG